MDAGKHENRIPLIKAVVRSTLDEILKHDYFCACPSGEKIIKICAGTPPTTDKSAPDKFYVQLTEDDKCELVNLATMLYLRAWLENDSKAKESLTCYASHGLFVKHPRSRHDYNSSRLDIRSKFLSAKNKYTAMMGVKNEWIINTYPDEAINLPPKSKQGQKEEIGFIDLCFIQWIADHSFLFYDLLVNRVTLLEVTTPEKEPNEALREAYSKYFKAIQDAKAKKPLPLLDVSENASDRNVRYVATAFMLQKIESTFQHITSVYLAHSLSFACQYSIQDITLLTTPWWARYDYPSSIRDSSISNQPFDVRSCEKMNTMLYYQHRADSLSCELSRNILIDKDRTDAAQNLAFYQEAALYQSNRQIIMRSLLLDTLLDLNQNFSTKDVPEDEGGCHPLRGHPHWTNKDFADVANFLKTDYPIIEQHPSERFGDPYNWSDETCDAIRNFYQIISFYALTDLRKKINNFQS